jgi:hypothetical protein
VPVPPPAPAPLPPPAPVYDPRTDLDVPEDVAEVQAFRMNLPPLPPEMAQRVATVRRHRDAQRKAAEAALQPPPSSLAAPHAPAPAPPAPPPAAQAAPPPGDFMSLFQQSIENVQAGRQMLSEADRRMRQAMGEDPDESGLFRKPPPALPPPPPAPPEISLSAHASTLAKVVEEEDDMVAVGPMSLPKSIVKGNKWATAVIANAPAVLDQIQGILNSKEDKKREELERNVQVERERLQQQRAVTDDLARRMKLSEENTKNIKNHAEIEMRREAQKQQLDLERKATEQRLEIERAEKELVIAERTLKIHEDTLRVQALEQALRSGQINLSSIDPQAQPVAPPQVASAGHVHAPAPHVQQSKPESRTEEVAGHATPSGQMGVPFHDSDPADRTDQDLASPSEEDASGPSAPPPAPAAATRRKVSPMPFTRKRA